jgi:hypothetical protein
MVKLMMNWKGSGRKTVVIILKLPSGRAIAQVMGDLWWTNWYWGRISPSTSVSRANSHSTDCSAFIIIYISSVADTRGQLVADVPNGLSLTPPQEPEKNYITITARISKVEVKYGKPSVRVTFTDRVLNLRPAICDT